MDKKKILTLADDIFITLTAAEEETVFEAFNTFVEDAKLLDIPGVDDVEPLVFPHERKVTSLREDEVHSELSRTEILKNSKNAKGEYVVVPKVVK